MPRLLLSLLVAASPLFSAQSVVAARLDGQPLVYMKDGAIDACGIRIVIVDVPPLVSPASLITAYDVSFNLKSSGRAVVSAGSTDATLSDYESGNRDRRKAIAPQTIWFKAPGARPTAPIEQMNGKMLAGADPGTVLYVSDLEPVNALFSAHRARKPISIGVTRPGMPTERIYSGPIDMSDTDRKQVASCLDKLTARN